MSEFTPRATTHSYAPCARCDGRGHGPSAPSGDGWWHDETELHIHDLLDAANVSDTWDSPGWDERDEVECPICKGTGRIEITATAITDEEEIAF